jgi:hypothetical protein
MKDRSNQKLITYRKTVTVLPDFDSRTGISIEPTRSALAFILYFFKPWVGIDGDEFLAAWNTPVFVPTQAGKHEVVAYFPYPFFKQAGKASAIVSVSPGQTVSVRYKAPWYIFRPGKMITT